MLAVIEAPVTFLFQSLVKAAEDSPTNIRQEKSFDLYPL